MRYTTAHYREGKAMNLILHLLFWYAIVFGIFLLYEEWCDRKSQASVRHHEGVIVLKEGQTIIGVVDRPSELRFSIAMDVADEKSYE
jgi:hypothetical protein